MTFFKSCKKILDVVCGDGEFAKLARNRVIGIDSNTSAVTNCKENGLSIVRGDAQALPFANETFDGVHCSHVIEHLYPADAFRMLSEIGRVLKKNGVFVLSTPLLWEGFYEDFSHIKPYYPNAILRYLVHDGAQKTMGENSSGFKKAHQYYRYRPVYLPGKIGRLISNFLWSKNIHTLRKDAYTLVLKKIA